MIDVKARVQALGRRDLPSSLDLPYMGHVEERLLYAWTKRFIDLIISAIALLVLSPVLAAIALAVRLDSPGPALFAQRRVGKGGKEFTLVKFRSMYYGADEGIHRAFAKQYIHGQCEVDGNTCFKPKDDPRVTRVGKFLRMTSLDELPQLWNVLKGDMSMVGPRPAVRYEVEEYERWQLQRLAVLPGLTGLAQVSGRSSLAFNAIARLDVQYTEERNLWLDLWILVMTVPVVLLAKAAR
ncbi:MAG: sugar transferase [Chloroflexi bacterium]|nr:sugar transferase [Chloroflexota bacterium]